MALNEIFSADVLSVVVTNPTAPVSGDMCRYGNMTGVCLTDEGEGGNISTETSVDFGMKVWDLLVTDVATGGIAVGDSLFYHDGAPGTLDNISASGYFFGFALEAIGSGLSDTIKVAHVPSPGAGTLGSGTVGTTNLANSAVTAAKIASDAVTTAKILAANVTEAKIEAGAAGAGLTGLVAKLVADANVIGGLPVLHRVNITAGALGNTDVTLTHKTRVIDAWLVLRGAGVATTTLQVKNGANAITDAMAASGSDQAVVRCASLDDAYWEIAAGGTLRVTSATGATQPDATVYVLGIRVA